jgi:hypothetical protein
LLSYPGDPELTLPANISPSEGRKLVPPDPRVDVTPGDGRGGLAARPSRSWAASSVSAIHERISHGESVDTAIPTGCRERLRAVLMTALLASLGLLPAALSHAIGSETQRPIAVVVVAGTVSAAFVSLVALPVFYAGMVRVRAAFERWGDARSVDQAYSER